MKWNGHGIALVMEAGLILMGEYLKVLQYSIFRKEKSIKIIYMVYTIISFFALAAILGAILLSYILQGKETPKGIAILHGLFAATGLVLIIYYAVSNKPG